MCEAEGRGYRDRMRAARAFAAGIGAVAGAVAAYRLLGPGVRRHTSSGERTVTIDRTAAELYALWRDLANAPRFMERVHGIETIDERRSHWVGKTPGGTPAEWDAEVTEDRSGELIAWRSEPPGLSGRVEFRPAPGGRGTRVRLQLQANLARTALERLAAEDLRRFKRLAETGEVVTVAGQPSGKRSPLGRVLAGRRERRAA